MKKQITIKDLKNIYNPEEIISLIDETFKQNRNKIFKIINNPNSPVLNYYKPRQISLLEKNSAPNNSVSNELVDSMKDAIFFMTLDKKNRTNVTKRMRNYEYGYAKAVFSRINHFLADGDILFLPSWSGSKNKLSNHKLISGIYEFFKAFQSIIEIEIEYWESISRVGYLTGFQISMGRFFMILKNIGMPQKDQISLVQSIFDGFNVDWSERDRENIRTSLQKPAIINYEKQQTELRQLVSQSFFEVLNPEIIIMLEEISFAYKKYLRRF